MPTGWDSILTFISFDDCYTDGLEMLLDGSSKSEPFTGNLGFLRQISSLSHLVNLCLNLIQ